MNYYNVFIIIFVIDIFILLSEGIVYFTFTKDNFQKEIDNFISGKLTFLSKYKSAITTNIDDEQKFISKNTTLGIVYFVVFIIGLFILAGLYIWIVKKILHKNIDFKSSLIVISIALIFIIVLEVSAIFTTFMEYTPDYIEISIWINNKIIEFINRPITPNISQLIALIPTAPQQYQFPQTQIPPQQYQFPQMQQPIF